MPPVCELSHAVRKIPYGATIPPSLRVPDYSVKVLRHHMNDGDKKHEAAITFSLRHLSSARLKRVPVRNLRENGSEFESKLKFFIFLLCIIIMKIHVNLFLSF